MTSPGQPFREPLRATLLRTGTIAMVLGAVRARSWGGLARWPLGDLLALWPSLGGPLGGSLVPQLAAASPFHCVRRAGCGQALRWGSLGGIGLAIGMRLTAMALGFRMAPWA